MSQYLFERSLHVSELGRLLLADSQSMDVIEANDRQWMGWGAVSLGACNRGRSKIEYITEET